MKNKYSSILLFLLAFVGLAVSCTEFEISEYDKDDAAIYIARSSQGDSITHSFLLVPGDGPDTVYLSVRTMGHLSDMDRPFVLKQTNSEDEDAAVPGVHYVPFDDNQVARYFTVPANRASVNLPIIFLRDKSLDTMRVRLALSVVENDYFRPGIDKWRDFVITTTSQAARPSYWTDQGGPNDTWGSAFGVWGPVKMKFIVDATGYTTWHIRPADTFYISYLKSKVKSKLLEYNATHDEPLKEADGTLVTFP